MLYEVMIKLYVDKDANFLSSSKEWFKEDLTHLINRLLYEIDDIKVEELLVEEVDE